MTTSTKRQTPDFCEEFSILARRCPNLRNMVRTSDRPGKKAIADPTDKTAVFQTLLAADACAT